MFDPQRRPSAIAVGHSVPADLVLTYSRGWNTRGEGSDRESEKLEFYYELDANPDTWIIGGWRRAQFTARVRSAGEGVYMITDGFIAGTRADPFPSAVDPAKGGPPHVSEH